MGTLIILFLFLIIFLIADITVILFSSILLASSNSTFELEDSKTIKQYYEMNSDDFSKFGNIFNMLGVIVLIKPVDYCTVLLIKLFRKG